MVGKGPEFCVQRRASATEDMHRWRRTWHAVGGNCEDFPGVLHSRFPWNLKKNKQTSVLAAYEKAWSSGQGHWSVLPTLTGDIPGVSLCPRPDKQIKARWIIHRQQTFNNQSYWIGTLCATVYCQQRFMNFSITHSASRGSEAISPNICKHLG